MLSEFWGGIRVFWGYEEVGGDWGMFGVMGGSELCLGNWRKRVGVI